MNMTLYFCLPLCKQELEMNEVPEIKLALKKKGLKYKLQSCDSGDGPQDYLTFLDLVSGTKVNGKIVRSFNEGEINQWPLLNHENITPLLDILSIRDDLTVFLTVDFPVKLKDIIHDDEFLYDSKCFDRKRAYARGIFSGLSYIHGKSLCLMNLSDDNIFICKLHDKAVISNFSCLTCSQKITRDKLKVHEFYKAPESEKGEFDATAAEIFASGTLMMDMFLVHSVPWAIIDYNQRRVMKMVDKLSLELFQSANPGSVISTIDLMKLKTFLKCFFTENPLFRITAENASKSSFLRTKFQENAFQINPIKKMLNPNCNSVTQQIKKKPKTDNPCNSVNNDFNKQGRPEKCFDSDKKSGEIFLDSETSNCYNAGYTSNCTEEHNFFSNLRNTTENTSAKLSLHQYKSEKETITSEIITKQNNSMENVYGKYKQNQSHRESFHDFSDNYETFLKPEITSKSCEVIKDKTNSSKEFSNAYFHSKSLAFINPIIYQTSNEISSQLNCRRKCSCSSIISLSLKQSKLEVRSNVNDCEESYLCLSNENELSEKSINEFPENEFERITDKDRLINDDTKRTKQKFNDSQIILHLNPRRSLSYRMATEFSANQKDKQGEYICEKIKELKERSMCVKENEGKPAGSETCLQNKISRNVNDGEKLENTEVWNDTCCESAELLNKGEEDALNTKKVHLEFLRKTEKKLKKKNKKESKVPNYAKKIERVRKPFFFSLCSGSKVQEPLPNLDDLCEICKLKYGVL